ncbi:hypothetical protein HanIR_Chr17g0889951 [Helianthus annuus]|nr:hypothetical protein HanIR_Chr17g0889951 [Helianthus annuus]
MCKLTHLNADQNCIQTHMYDVLGSCAIITGSNVILECIPKCTMGIVKVSKVIVPHSYALFNQICL